MFTLLYHMKDHLS